MNREQEINKILQDICKRAIDGELTLKDFNGQWPQDAKLNPFFQQLYEDIEDGVEHIPGFIFSRSIDYKSWHESETYFILCLDFILLGMDKNADELLECRTSVLEQGILSEKRIKDQVNEFFKKKPLGRSH